jgi:hypothetical protein
MAAQPRTDCAAADIHRHAVIQNVNAGFMAGQILKLVEIFLIARPVQSKSLDQRYWSWAFKNQFRFYFFRRYCTVSCVKSV